MFSEIKIKNVIKFSKKTLKKMIEFYQAPFATNFENNNFKIRKKNLPKDIHISSLFNHALEFGPCLLFNPHLHGRGTI